MDRLIKYLIKWRMRTLQPSMLIDMMDADTQELYTEQLLANPILSHVFDKIERDTFDAWKNTTMGDVETRERAWVTLKSIEMIRGELLAVLNGSQYEQYLKKESASAAGTDKEE